MSDEAELKIDVDRELDGMRRIDAADRLPLGRSRGATKVGRVRGAGSRSGNECQGG
jgi:hypothetical protein